MSTIPEPGSVWVDKSNPKHEAVVVWADEKTVVYDYSDGIDYCYRYSLHYPDFLKRYEPKPRTIHIGEYDVPEPLRVAPVPHKTTVYYAKIHDYESIRPEGWVWIGDMHDMEMLRRGLLHLTKEAAELHAKAIISLTEIKQ